ncbi:MAG TPA: BTAD domain-containing putative transcriptional regulator [Pseudonocardiaceae bacterium]|jgi:DNA-binding SARP family transcriptional activator|nr:BTAD domain-containing putative transcriptional regulator [Pseudonocardiaceae bacterium]
MTTTAPAGPVRFALFGGVRAWRGDVELPLGPPRQRALLQLLLVAGGEPVGMSEIVTALWLDEPAASATNQVRRHVGELRRRFEPELGRRAVGRWLLPTSSGYRIAVDATNLDLLRFRELTRQGADLAATSAEAATALLAQALEVARAAPGDDSLRGLPRFVAAEDERVRAVTGAARIALSAGLPGDVLPWLSGIAGAHPFHELLQACLMDCLTRSGRSADALALFERVRTRLRDELGIDPGAALTQAQARALAGPAGPAPAVTATPPAQLPAPLPGFAGRRRLLAALREDSPQRMLLITGMAGVGKTTLALRHAAEIAHDYPDGQLYVNLRGFDATSAPTDPLGALGDLLEGLGVPWQGQPESVGGRAGLLRGILARKRVLLVLDNVHHYRQVEPLLPGAGASRAIVTSRNGLPGLVAFNHARLVQLEPFDDDEVVEFFGHRLAKSVDRDAVIKLGRACAGLPLALAIVAARAAANPDFALDMLVREFTVSPLAHLNAGSADLDLGTVFSWSQRGLSDDATRAFAALSVHPGPEISIAAAVSVSGLGPRRTRDVLTELTLASVLRESTPGRFVCHDLVREYALSLLADNAPEATARLVQHYVRSTRAAIRSFGQSPAAPADSTVQGIIAETFVSSRDATRWYVEERHVLHQVCRLAVDVGDHRSALMLMLDWRPMSQAVDARHDMLPFAELAIKAVENMDEPALRAECYRDVASNFARTSRPERARTYFDRAAAAFEQAGDRLGAANVQRSMAVTLVMDADERVCLLGESVAVARQFDDQPVLATSLHSLGLGLLWAARYHEALTAFAECATIIATAPGLSSLEAHMLSGRSRALAGAGRLAESAEVAEKALAFLRRDGKSQGELRLLRSHGDVLTALGRTAEGADVWRRFLFLARSPELVQETNSLDDDTEGSVTVDRVRAKLAVLAVAPADHRAVVEAGVLE